MNKSKLPILLISLICLMLLITAFDNYLIIIKCFLFLLTLITAGYIDIKTKTIPDYIHVLIILIGLIKIDLIKSIIGLMVAVIVNHIYYTIKNKSKNISFPLVQCLAVGYISIFLLCRKVV